MISGDFNNDEFVDTLVALPDEGKLILFETTGKLDEPLKQTVIPAGIEAPFVASGDVDGDGLTDICALSYLDQRLSILSGGYEKPYTESSHIDVPFFDLFIIDPGRYQPLACSDTDSDGRDEIFTIQPDGGDKTCIYRHTRISSSQEDNNFTNVKLTLYGYDTGSLQAIDFVDFNGDSIPELILFTEDPPTLLVCDPLGDSEYIVTAEFSFEDTLLGNDMVSFKRHDADSDGRTDVIAVPFDGTIRLFSLGETGLEQSIIGDLGGNAIHDDILANDLDRDGSKDLLAVSRQTSGGDSYEQLSVVCGENPGEFRNHVTFVTGRIGSPFSKLKLGSLDLNRDGWDDIVFLDDYRKELVLILNVSQSGVLAWNAY